MSQELFRLAVCVDLLTLSVILDHLIPLLKNAQELDAVKGGKLQISLEASVLGVWFDRAAGNARNQSR